ncbi:hypothetical protein BD414DRAFT_578024 [Trametes punicea]|nr:hypothetical protein BD414DRAFT_578024 [Trametes punicea]
MSSPLGRLSDTTLASFATIGVSFSESRPEPINPRHAWYITSPDAIPGRSLEPNASSSNTAPYDFPLTKPLPPLPSSASPQAGLLPRITEQHTTHPTVVTRTQTQFPRSGRIASPPPQPPDPPQIVHHFAPAREIAPPLTASLLLPPSANQSPSERYANTRSPYAPLPQPLPPFSRPYSPPRIFILPPPPPIPLPPVAATARDEDDSTFEIRRESSPVQCTACTLEINISAEDAVQAPCLHIYHAECLLTFVRNAIDSTAQFPPRCCRRTIPTSLFEPYLTPELKEALAAREAERNTPRRVYCANPQCSRFLGAQDDGVPVRVYTCSVLACQTRTCARCRSALDCETSHHAHVCRGDPAGNETLRLGKRMGWTRCPRCTELVERKSGCPHMKCRCGADFCYLCGELYRDCTCGSEGLQGRGGATRRERDFFALAQPEDFERELMPDLDLASSDESL